MNNNPTMIFKSTDLASLAAIPTHGAGCYPVWTSGSDYFTGSLVSATITKTSTSTASDGTVTETTTSQMKNFKCTSGSQLSLSHCPNYDPSNAVQQAAAWSDEGVCSRITAAMITPAPTTKPTPSRWTNEGCPKEWTSGGLYEGGDLVELDRDVYSCSTSTGANLWCGLDAYKPGDSVHWEQAWKLLGSCDGTIPPTMAPAYLSLADHNGCPVEFDASATYEAGDKVELYGLVYECRSWPNAGWCSQDGYEPDGPNYKDAWTVLGYCKGTMAPTTSPNFSSLAEIGDGCPKEYASSNEVYEAGDQVSVHVNSGASVVYECKSWPNGIYCNSGDNFAPATNSGNLGWTKKGFCDGTLSPTNAPIAYAPDEKCRWYNGTKAITIQPWSDAKRSTYVVGTRVRKGTHIYKCKSWPYFLWCQTNNYEPKVGTAWGNAWTKAGECNGQFEPTASPSASPTGAPSSEPSSGPSSGPASLFPSESPSFITTTTIAIESFVELNANCNDLGAATAGHVEDSISDAVGPALGENQNVDS
eukprot:scaffold16748_cov50-Cyclotella_meneghiniana.AAC.2